MLLDRENNSVEKIMSDVSGEYLNILSIHFSQGWDDENEVVSEVMIKSRVIDFMLYYNISFISTSCSLFGLKSFICRWKNQTSIKTPSPGSWLSTDTKLRVNLCPCECSFTVSQAYKSIHSAWSRSRKEPHLSRSKRSVSF